MIINDSDESDDSFEQRRRQLNNIHRQFKRAISEMKTLSEASNTEIFDNAEDEINNVFFNQSKAERIIENSQIRSLVRELYTMKNEVLNLQSIVLRANASQRSIQAKLLPKLKLVVEVITRHILRAETLLIDE